MRRLSAAEQVRRTFSPSIFPSFFCTFVVAYGVEDSEGFL
jgi:hypothetical protein